jgi:hypothetical protein
MPSSKSVLLQPVDGEWFRQSNLRLLGVMGFILLCVTTCGVIAYLRWRAQGTISFALVGLVVFSVLVLALLTTLLFLSLRLVLGPDRLQVLNGSTKVVVEFPYRNIERVWVAKDSFKNKIVAVKLKDPADATTYAPGGQDALEKCAQEQGYHYAFAGFFKQSPEHIAGQIEARLVRGA